jgi:hypothetical protein
MASLKRRLSLRSLKQECASLEGVVAGQQSASADELAGYRPGGARNADKFWWGWIRWYAQLVRFNARDRGDSSESTGGEDRLVLDALRNAAIPVQIEPAHRVELAPEDAPPIMVAVYPKSVDALLYLDAKDYLLGWLAQKIGFVRERGTEADLGLLERAHVEMSYQQRLVAWCVMHDGRGLPFDPYVDSRPALPPHVAQLGPLDFFRIYKAYTTCNVTRLKAVSALIAPPKPDGTTDRPSWSAFLGTLADERHIQPATLMRDYSLGELLASVKVAAGVRAEAEEKAKAGED